VGELQRGTDLHTPYTPPNSGDVFSGGSIDLGDVGELPGKVDPGHGNRSPARAFRPENLHTTYTPTKNGYGKNSVTT